MIKTGRYGQIRFDPTPDSPASPSALISVNAWTLSLKTDYEDVTCFQDTNKVYVPGLRDISGTIGGFFNADDMTLVHASNLATPGLLELIVNTTEEPSPTSAFSGLAYMDAEINCSLGAPKISGTFKAAGPWSTP